MKVKKTKKMPKEAPPEEAREPLHPDLQFGRLPNHPSRAERRKRSRRKRSARRSRQGLLRACSGPRRAAHELFSLHLEEPCEVEAPRKRKRPSREQRPEMAPELSCPEVFL